MVGSWGSVHGGKVRSKLLVIWMGDGDGNPNDIRRLLLLLSLKEKNKTQAYVNEWREWMEGTTKTLAQRKGNGESSLIIGNLLANLVQLFRN